MDSSFGQPEGEWGWGLLVCVSTVVPLRVGQGETAHPNKLLARRFHQEEV